MLGFSLLSHAQEICNNGIDDDANGLIDLNDTAQCSCLGSSLNNLNLIPNPSFELMNCCPWSFTGFGDTNQCATSWFNGTLTSSDYMNTCGWFPGVIPTPIPTGQGIMGTYAIADWSEYIGSCLNAPLEAGKTYDFSFKVAGNGTGSGTISYSLDCPYPAGALDIVLFGKTNCSTFPENTYGCPKSVGWEILGFVNCTPSSTWNLVSFTFKPIKNINAIMIGPSCSLSSSYPTSYYPQACFPYIMYDDLVLKTQDLKSFSIDTIGDLCTNNLMLHATMINGNITGQWYRNGIAIVGQIDSILNVSTLGLKDGKYTFLQNYNGGCISSHINIFLVDCDKDCGSMSLLIPNAFTPNKDNLNDVFLPIIIQDCFEVYDFKIYDRWGELVFSTTNLKQGWDGNYKNKACELGTYYYLIQTTSKTNKKGLYKGDVNLIR